MSSTVSPHDALQQFFPEVDDFRDCQLEAIERIWAGKSTLLLMPTGMGKSLIFQLPILASDKIGIIVSPLIALMQQQAQKLVERGAHVLSLGGASDAKWAQEQLKKFPWDGGKGFLFVSPERAETDGYLEFLLRKHKDQIGLIAIDEAHCISQWGHDFRPPYKSLPGIFDRSFGRDHWPTILCLTATLDEKSQAEIVKDFRITSGDVVSSQNMLRTNLNLSFKVFKDSNEKLDALEKILDDHRDEKIIVYAHRIKSKKNGTRSLSERFHELGHSCAAFDSNLSLKEKDEVLARFATGDLKVVFATGAFGMGVDIPDIRGVIHYLLPESLEQYYQEVGRAGRDGNPAFGKLLYCASNGRIQRGMIEKSLRTADQIHEVWGSLVSTGKSELKTINPWTEFQSKEEEYSLFYAFNRIGAIEILARGPARLNALVATSPESEILLGELSSATRTKNIGIAIRKLGCDPDVICTRLFQLYDELKIELSGSLDKTLYFKHRAIEQTEVDAIAADIAQKVETRMGKFEELVSLIESEADPSDALRERFGT